MHDKSQKKIEYAKNKETIEMIDLELKELIQKVAETHGKSVAEIETEIESTISEAYENPTKAALTISRKGKVPTIKEFVEFLLQKS